jgi:hypothetical protein
MQPFRMTREELPINAHEGSEESKIADMCKAKHFSYHPLFVPLDNIERREACQEIIVGVLHLSSIPSLARRSTDQSNQISPSSDVILMKTEDLRAYLSFTCKQLSFASKQFNSVKISMSLKMASQAFSLTTRKTLPNTQNLSIPHIHLGVYLTSGKETSTAVRYALEAGYRAFDSAQMYHNEREVGSTISSYLQNHPELKREDIHYTSKLASNASYETVRKSITKSVKECGLGYIDLFLLHSPYGGKEARLSSWKALEDAVLDGEVRIPGVSNYGEKHVSRACPCKTGNKPRNTNN